MDSISGSKRRKLLTTAASVVGSLGVVGAAVPFVASFMPSWKVRDIDIDIQIDISGIAPGELKVVEWQRRPVLILRRTEEMLKNLAELEYRLKDPKSENFFQQPDYARNSHRSLNEEYLVVLGICTHMGCIPSYLPEHKAEEVGDWWRGGFLCPCHLSEYDLAGRVFKGRSPAPMNLPVPPHHFIDDNILIIGS